MDYLLLGVYAGALVIGILGPVLVLCLYRNLRGCTRYPVLGILGPVLVLCLYRNLRGCTRYPVLGILGPVLVLCLFRNLRGCTRYRQVVPWSSASSDLSSSSASTGT
jgi:hypothetical protein